MFRIIMVSIIVTIGLTGCGEDVSQKPMHEKKAAVEAMPSVVKNEVNTQDVKKNDVQAIDIQSQTTEASQAVAESLAKEQVSTMNHAEPLKVIKEKVNVEAVKEKAPAEIVEVKKHEVVVVDAGVKTTKITPDSVPTIQSKHEIVLGDAAKGKALAKRCTSCHDFGKKDKVGPHLQGVFNRAAGQSGFKRHSAAFKAANWTWDEAHLLKWLCDSKAAVKEFTGNASAKTKMPKQNMCGVKGHDIVAYLKTL